MTGVAHQELTSTATLDFIVNSGAWPLDGRITYRVKRLPQVMVLPASSAPSNRLGSGT